MTYAGLKRKWSGQKASLGIGGISANSYCMRIDQYGGNGGCGSGTTVTEVFKTPQDALAWLRFTAIPFILAFDAAPDCDAPLKPAEQYLAYYRGNKKMDLTALLKLLDAAMVLPKLDRKALNTVVRNYNYAFHDTNPCSGIVAHGQALDFLSSPELQEEIAQTLDGEEDQKMVELAKVLKARTIDFDDPVQDRLLFDLLERLNIF